MGVSLGMCVHVLSGDMDLLCLFDSPLYTCVHFCMKDRNSTTELSLSCVLEE